MADFRPKNYPGKQELEVDQKCNTLSQQVFYFFTGAMLGRSRGFDRELEI